MTFVLTDEQKVGVKLVATTAAGNPAEVQDPKFSSSDESIITVVADPNDPTSAVVTAVGPLGSAQVSATADADLGEGVTEITAVDTVEVKAAQATTLGLTFGVPETK